MSKKDKDSPKTEDKSTKFKSGESGNPAGRPVGSTNKKKSMNLEEIQSYLSENTKFAMDVVLEIMVEEGASATTRLKAAIEWMSSDLKVRETIRKIIMDEYEFKTNGQIEAANKMQEKTATKENTPTVSLVAIKRA